MRNFNGRNAKLYCKEDISLIENYESAKKDNFENWHCHHKLEIGGDYFNTVEDLKLMNLYYNRPACELIFLKSEDHTRLHHKDKIPKNLSSLHTNNIGKKRTTEQKLRMSASAKNRKKVHVGGACFKGKHWLLIDGKRVWVDG